MYDVNLNKVFMECKTNGLLETKTRLNCSVKIYEKNFIKQNKETSKLTAIKKLNQ